MSTSDLLLFGSALVVFVIVVATFVRAIVRHGGLKAAMYGARIQRQVGEVRRAAPKGIRMAVRVHRLGSPPEQAVGLELVAKSLVSYQSFPIALSQDEAVQLARLLNAAVSDDSL